MLKKNSFPEVTIIEDWEGIRSEKKKGVFVYYISVSCLVLVHSGKNNNNNNNLKYPRIILVQY